MKPETNHRIETYHKVPLKKKHRRNHSQRASGEKIEEKQQGYKDSEKNTKIWSGDEKNREEQSQQQAEEQSQQQTREHTTEESCREPEAAIHKVQKIVKIPQTRDREHCDGFFQRIDEVSSAAKDSRDEQKIFTTTKENVEQNTPDIPVVIQRQILVIQKTAKTTNIPLLHYNDTTVDVAGAKDAEKTPKEQHEDCMTKYNEIQVDRKRRSADLRTDNKKPNVFDS